MDGQDAFARGGDRLTTRSENAIVIQSMVAIAREESRNGVVKVGGTDFFKKEAWFAANLAGFEVKGYAPTEFERKRCGAAIGGRTPPDHAPRDTAPSAHARAHSAQCHAECLDRRQARSLLAVRYAGVPGSCSRFHLIS